MDSNVAPPYVNAYMAIFEDTHIYSNDLYEKHALIWHRYIDDMFCIWLGDAISLNIFLHTSILDVQS